jgi:alkanesulfonate monooxygenase SsuD/methylene tetrahydromethanopterin reductase-like flavin-dependent oxidoreductase (luciferase family)
MRIAIGIPSRPEPGRPDHVLTWAEVAEAGPFSSIAVGDRVVAPAHEALAVLAACAGATRRIGLLAAAIVGPVRETTLLARQAASIDVLSGGRLTVGIGVGAREDDYRATGTDFRGRGRRETEQLGLLRDLLRGERLDGLGPIGPAPRRPGGPELLLGGYVPALAGRIAAFADGFLAPGGGEPAAIATLWRSITDAWSAAGREGAPRLVWGSYFALGPEADDAARAYIETYYGYDPAVAARRLATLPTTPDAVVATIRQARELGVDELILRPVRADLDMLERLADVVAAA